MDQKKWRFFFLLSVACLIANALQAEQRNFRLWGFGFNATAGFSVEFNDNISSAQTNKRSDIILLPSVDLIGEKKISDLNTLELNLGFAYSKYIKNSELDSIHNFLGISPDSALKLKIKAGHFNILIFDQFTYSIDAAEAATVQNGTVVNNVTAYGRFENTVGADIEYDATKHLKFGLLLSRSDTFPTSNTFSFARRHTYLLSPRIVYIVSPTFNYGLRGGVSKTTYSTNFNNDSTSYFIGPMAQWQVTPLFLIEASTDWRTYKSKTGGANLDTSSAQGIEYNLLFKHKLSQLFDHSLAVSRDIQLGFITNTDTRWSLDYQANWQVNSKLTAFGGASYDQGKLSGPLLPERADRYIFSIGLGHRWNKKLSSTIKYEFATKAANISGRGFDRNRLIIGFFYDL